MMKPAADQKSPATFAKDIAEMMRVWNSIIAKVRATFPRASEEEVYQISKGAMNKSLGI